MCLFFHELYQENYKTQLSRRVKKGWITLWKFFGMDEDGVVCGPCKRHHTYSYGITKSNRKSKKLDFNEEACGEIHKGIHVYNSLKVAKTSYLSYNSRNALAKVRVKLEDFVGGNDCESVFMKVWLTRDEYRKVKKKLKLRLKLSLKSCKVV